MVEVLTDPAELAAHEAGHGAVFRSQGRHPIKVAVSAKQRTYTAVDLTETTTVEFSARTTTAASGTRLQNIDAFLAGYLNQGFTIEQMLERRAAGDVGGDGTEGEDVEVQRVLRDRSDVQEALRMASDHVGKDRESDEVGALLTERAAEVVKILAGEAVFIAGATAVIAALCVTGGAKPCPDLEAAVAAL